MKFARKMLPIIDPKEAGRVDLVMSKRQFVQQFVVRHGGYPITGADGKRQYENVHLAEELWNEIEKRCTPQKENVPRGT